MYTNGIALQPGQLLPKGTVMAIKEPFYQAYNNDACIRVDHPSDIVFLDLGHAMYPKAWKTIEAGSQKTALDWKLEGNAALGRKEYVTANK